VLAGIKEIRDSIEEAKQQLSLFGRRTILFIDEVHRFNKSQQDALLPHVENGVIILIGATTENPYFEVNKALVSRSRIFQLKALTDDDLKRIAHFTIADSERGYGNRTVIIDDDALDHLVKVANGDARGVLNALELAIETTPPDAAGALRIDRAIAEDSIQQRAVLYDKDGDAHYDTISAFIKSMRGSDPDAALYWMSKMVYAGEDPRFIFRRMLILACEDVGMADPMALSVVVDAARAFDYVGLPEGRYHLAHACLYLATAPKSNSSMAFFDALGVVSEEAADDVPNPLRDASRDKEGFGHGEGYLYPHAYRDHWVAQQYLPQGLQGKVFYQPSDQGHEKNIRDRVARNREAQIEAMVEEESLDPFELMASQAGGPNPQHAVWVSRTGGLRGNQLAEVRDTLLKLADIAHDDLVLDLHARTGLLALEVNRMTKEGGVWALAHDKREYETLTARTQFGEGFSRPQAVLSGLETFDEDLYKAAGEGVRFNVMIGRNILTRLADKKAVVERALRLLHPKGRIVLAEVVPCMGQRLSELLDLSKQEASIAEKFLKVEQDLFSDSRDPMMNWDVEKVKSLLSGLPSVEIKEFSVTAAFTTKVLPAQVDFWFRPSSLKERKSLGGRLQSIFDESQIAGLKKFFHEQFDKRDVPWKAVTAYFKITRE
jgi:putative ATPase